MNEHEAPYAWLSEDEVKALSAMDRQRVYVQRWDPPPPVSLGPTEEEPPGRSQKVQSALDTIDRFEEICREVLVEGFPLEHAVEIARKQLRKERYAFADDFFDLDRQYDVIDKAAEAFAEDIRSAPEGV